MAGYKLKCQFPTYNQQTLRKYNEIIDPIYQTVKINI